MKKILFLFFVTLMAVPSFAQKDESAKALLDQTYAAFQKAGGIKAKFVVNSYKNGKFMGGSRGSILLKGTKFMLKTTASSIWFDGKTQWNYVYKNQEVNVSNPTTSELQNINPYYILSIYQRGFDYKMGNATQYGGKSGKEIVLTAQNKKQNISSIVLFVSADNEPMHISIDRKDGSRNDLTISSYKGGQNLDDNSFVFNKKKYPKVEVVDLR